MGKWSEKILQKKNYKYINRFSECWVPDVPGDNNLAGELSHPAKKPAISLKYIGLLSRFDTGPATTGKNKKDHLLLIFSGPEPQRSILENKLITEIAHYKSTATILRGLPGETRLVPSTGMIQFYNHLPADELSKEIEKAEYVISRSGYSSIMDLGILQKKTILIPTPGQTEQEYLAAYLLQKKIALCIQQKDFSLDRALEKAGTFSYQPVTHTNGQLLSSVVSAFISGLTKV